MPKDNAEQILAEAPQADPSDPGQYYHGGQFASVDPGNSGLATMNIVDDKKTT